MEKRAEFVQPTNAAPSLMAAPPTMATPAPGFTARVMERIERHERAQARRRSVIGAAILVGAASVPFLVLGYLFVVLGSLVIADPGAVLSGVFAVAPVFEILSSLFGGLTLGATTLARVGSVQMLAFAIAVCSLTFLWAAVVHGSSQWSPRTLSVGGSR